MRPINHTVPGNTLSAEMHISQSDPLWNLGNLQLYTL